MPSNRHVLNLSLLLFFSFSLAGCQQLSCKDLLFCITLQKDDQLTLGVVMPIGDPACPSSMEHWDDLKSALKQNHDVKNHPVEWSIEDSMGLPEPARQAYNRLLENASIPVIFDLSCTFDPIPAARLASDDGRLVIITHPFLSSSHSGILVNRSGLSPEQLYQCVLDVIRDLNDDNKSSNLFIPMQTLRAEVEACINPN